MKGAIKKILRVLPYAVTRALVLMPFLRIKELREMRPYFGHEGLQRYWLDFRNGNQKHKVIVYGLRTYSTHHQAVFEKIFSDSFRYNGADVKNLVCGGILPSCDGAQGGLTDRQICGICCRQRQDHMKNFPNDFISFDRFVTREEIAQIRKEVDSLCDEELERHIYKGVRVGRHAFDSVEFGFQFLYDRANESHRKKLRDSVYRGMITVKVAENLFAAEKPTHLFTLHGCYASWGPFAEYLSRAGVSVYVYEILLTPGMGYFQFYKGVFDNGDKRSDVRKEIPAVEVWEKRKDRALTEEEKERLYSFLLKRKSGTSFDYRMFYERKNAQDDTCLRIINSDQKKFVLYMNSLWDRGIEDVASDCFDGHVEWLKETIEYFMTKKDVFLLIKPHPAEFSVWEYQKNGGGDVVRNLFRKLPPHVVLMSNNLSFTSYELMDKGCIGITYFGTVGLESSFFRKPVLVGGNTHYTKAGVVYRVRSKREYFQLIDNPEPLRAFPGDHYELIERYAYHYFFSQSIRIPFYRDDTWLGHCIHWDVLSNYKDFVENDKTLNHIVRSVLCNEHIVNPDEEKTGNLK
ncbi:MAG: hypothetical protein WC552_08820 [Candidatus Omnitrophota bacterium]